jgi:hypothetical protein
MLHMMFKLGQCAEKKWRRLRGFDYLTKVMTGVKFKDDVEVTELEGTSKNTSFREYSPAILLKSLTMSFQISNS